MKRAKTGQ
ncbi:KH domain-containing protein SPIN1 [Zea mays]|uniref:KH domain-containing protein SPIN1 n=1 Tax=Zea mays TaxID=4577 RepID=A0A1D6GER0_MAIZE|nr:KH domain-containing protein SPIN1 [Zea mays]